MLVVEVCARLAARCSVFGVADATITCPLCGTSRRETMPENACRHFYRCTGCGETLKPKDGDCCVFCSYADTQCPPRQAQHDYAL